MAGDPGRQGLTPASAQQVLTTREGRFRGPNSPQNRSVVVEWCGTVRAVSAVRRDDRRPVDGDPGRLLRRRGGGRFLDSIGQRRHEHHHRVVGPVSLAPADSSRLDRACDDLRDAGAVVGVRRGPVRRLAGSWFTPKLGEQECPEGYPDNAVCWTFTVAADRLDPDSGTIHFPSSCYAATGPAAAARRAGDPCRGTRLPR